LKAEEYVSKLFPNAGQPTSQAHVTTADQDYQSFQRIPRMNKCKPCFAFRSGTCTKGDRCIYAHGEDERMAAIANFQQQMPPPQPSAEMASGSTMMTSGHPSRSFHGGFPQHQQHYHHAQHHQQFHNHFHHHSQPQSSSGLGAPVLQPPGSRRPRSPGPSVLPAPRDDDSIFETPPVPPVIGN
jgi:hypothetical protein